MGTGNISCLKSPAPLRYFIYLLFFHGTTAPSGPGPHYRGFKITLI